MILVAGKNRGKRLIRKVVDELSKHGTVQLAAVSPQGVERLVNTCAKLSDHFPKRVKADTEKQEIEVESGHYRIALVVTLTVK